MQQPAIIKDSERLTDPCLMSPRTVGDIVSASVRICRQNVRLLMKLLMWPAAASAAAHVVTLFGLIQMESAVSPDGSDVTSWTNLLTGVGIIGAGLLFALPIQVILVLRQLAVLRVVARFSETLKEADKFLWKNFWKLIVIGFLTYTLLTVWIIVWTVIVVLVTVVGALLHAPYLTIAMVMFTFVIGAFSVLLFLSPMAVVVPAAACEDKGLIAIISDGTALAFRNFWRTCGFCTLLGMVVYLLGFTLGFPGQIVYLIEYIKAALAGTMPKSADIPFYAHVITTVWHSVVNIFVGPVVSISAGLYYFDLRVREQGLDILRLVQTSELTDSNAR